MINQDNVFIYLKTIILMVRELYVQQVRHCEYVWMPMNIHYTYSEKSNT